MEILTLNFSCIRQSEQNSNVIHKLTEVGGTVCFGKEMIKQEIRDFYSLLMETSADELTVVDKLTVDNGPKLNIQQQRLLNVDCSEHEVKVALFSMDSNKAPGIDGFNVCFFKKKC